jgi:hypothetical protein
MDIAHLKINNLNKMDDETFGNLLSWLEDTVEEMKEADYRKNVSSNPVYFVFE